MNEDEISLEAIDRYIEGLGQARKRESALKKENRDLKSESEDLKSKLDEALTKISSLEQFKVSLADEEITLQEAKLRFLKAAEDEINSRADERVEKLRKVDEESMPQLIYNRLNQILKAEEWPTEIANAVEHAAQRRVSDILYSREKWPIPFVLYYQQEVSKGIKQGLNDEFSRHVIEGVRTTFNQLKTNEWRQYVDQRLQPVVTQGLGNFLLKLKGAHLAFDCPYCKQGFPVEITPEVLSMLMTRGWVEVICPNTNCRERDFLYRLTHGGENPRRKLHLDLKIVLEAYIGSCP